ncbi:MAG: hypothetical protein JKY95_13475 [Planctomycetaceae bacterium]|nr:hypothetical protein [Planctomycetaceae bacterium]
MSFTRLRPLAAALMLAVIPSGAGEAQAQLFRNLTNPCNTCAPPQQVAYNPCSACSQQVVYRSVPVTQYHQVTRTVRKPIVETAYEDRQVTQYRTVYETKTAQIPTVSYQNVTSYKTVTRDMGRWTSFRQPIHKVSACEYDNSRGLLGFLNRSRHNMRNALTPNSVTRRQYQSNVVAMQVPVHRQVAIRGMQTVNYQVARLEPFTTTHRVAVRKIRYEDQQVVAMVPTTTYRTVPIGTQTAYGFVPYQAGGAAVTAQAPVPDPNFTRSAQAPKPAASVPDKTAGKEEAAPKKTSKKPDGFDAFKSGDLGTPRSREILPASFGHTVNFTPSPASSAKPTVPSMIRSNGWHARTSVSEPSLPSSGPTLAGPSLHVVDATN